MAKRKYRVREGFTYGAKDEYAAGSIVELEEEEAKHAMDKLELAEVVQNVPDEAVEMDSAQMTADSTDSRSNSPETLDDEEKEDKVAKDKASISHKRSKGKGD